VEEPYRLTPQLALRVAVLGFVVLGAFAVLFLRLWALQVLSGSTYSAEASTNRVRTVSLGAPRGAIVAADGQILVTNRLVTNLEVYSDDLPKSRSAELSELRRISTAVGVPVSQILGEIRASIDDPLVPVVLARAINTDEVDFFKERDFEFPGIQLVDTYERQYPYGWLAAQVLGYVGPIEPGELKSALAEGYQPQDSMGQAGLEASYDRYLRGADGTAELTVNALGQPVGQVTTTVLPQQGDTLRLTLNLRLQQSCENALRFGIQLAHTTSDGTYADGGAIVALDPANGAVLAMCSNPSYNPSIFVTHTPAQLAPLLNPKTAAAMNYPGVNRAIDVGYPPGSTFKPVTALAAMEEGILTPTELIPCTPRFTFYQQVFTNWNPDFNQLMDLPEAIEQSCDTFFYRIGARFYDMPANLGPTLQNWADRFGFGAPTGVDVGPEYAGIVPTPAWRCEAYGGQPSKPSTCTGYVNRVWKPGYEVQLAIGQGDLLVTPIQMARFYAMIANGGYLVTPHLAEDIEAPGDDGQPQILRDLAIQQPTPTGVSQVALDAVRGGLYDGAHNPLGTSYGVFGDFPIPIVGKTGTAQKDITIPGDPTPQELNQSWWCGYGPYNRPTLVVCAVIENGGHGGTAAAPAALQVFEQYFHRTGTVTPHISD
jgi:penicillin-binding protein 2